MIEQIEHIFSIIVQVGQLFVEIIGAAIILYYAARAALLLVKRDKIEVCHQLLSGISLGLEFLLAGEVLHTIIAKDLNTLLAVGVTFAMRAMMTYLIHWENKIEEKENADISENKEKKVG